MQKNGIILSAKKNGFCKKKEIDFLGMNYSHGEHTSGPHISKEHLQFPDIGFTTKKIQQCLGIIN